MKRVALISLGLVASGFIAACGNGDDTAVAVPDAAPDVTPSLRSDAGAADVADVAVVETSVVDASDAGEAGPDPCAEAGVPPSTLECAGLYADFATQTVASGAQAYAPAAPLWSDGAVKQRWIELPPGQKIDVTDPNEWVFPVGTKVFKQFTYEGVRVETRMFQKVAADFWVHAAYEWNAAQTATTITYGDTVPVDADGGTWVIPTPDDCDSCHRGRTDRVLGFEQVSLGLDGATGLTLLQLVVQNLVTPAPTQVNLRIGNDGTGLDGPALSWLHVNCGVTCHNTNENADGYGAGMNLRLDPTLLDGTPASSSWGPLGTTVGVPCVSGAVQGIPRILPGNPSGSAIVQLISERGALQMPPIASRVVDTTNVAAVVDWIQQMPAAEGGVQDAGGDGGRRRTDAGSGPEGGLDATTGESGAPDATMAGAGEGGEIADAGMAFEAAADAGNAGTEDAGEAGNDDASSMPDAGAD